MRRLLLLALPLLIFINLHAQQDQLSYYLEQGLKNSPLLQDYQNQKASTRYDSLLIRASNKAQVSGSSFNMYAPVIHGIGYDQAITNGGTFTSLVGVNKALPNKKNLETRFESLELENQRLSNTSSMSEQELKRTITAQYITASSSLEQWKVNRQISKLLGDEEVILKKLTQQNIYKQADYLSFLVMVQQQTLAVKQSELQYHNDLSLLKYSCGIADSMVVELQAPVIDKQMPAPVSRSVFFTQFQIDSLILQNQKRQTDIAYRPQINLFADAGFNSSWISTAYKNFGTSFGAGLTIPIYDGKQRKLQYSKIDVQEQTRQVYRDFFMQQYQQDLGQAQRQLTETESLLRDIREQMKYTQSLIDVNARLLETGEARITDYIIAISNYINVQNLVIQYNTTRLLLINQINYWSR